MITKKFIAIIVLVLVFGGLVAFQQIYVDGSVGQMRQEIQALDALLEEENLEASIEQAEKIVGIWNEREAVICLFVDFRDIEAIGRQADLVVSHLGNADFELAKVECNTLMRVLNTFGKMVNIDWQNVI